jgi:competence protein ComEC
VLARVRLLEDASRTGDVYTLHAAVAAVRVREGWRDTSGIVSLTVGGARSDDRADEWRAGRTVEAAVTFRRPSRYLDEGVPDFERDLALAGTTLFGSIKSALLVRVVASGSPVQEAAALARRRVRGSVERWVGRHDTLSAAIVTAVLIGDRSGLPDEVRRRLQSAGTYHVIAISGGNIAILAGLALASLYLCRLGGRGAAFVTVLILIAYAQVVTAGPSVWRATVMAVIYLCARVIDHRSAPWHTLAAAVALIVCTGPLEVRDVGFILTCGATAALIEGARRLGRVAPRHLVAGWLIASIAASTAAEVALLPVSAWTFSRVTSAGLLLNLAAVPLMVFVQVGGLVVACVDQGEAVAGFAGWIAHSAAWALVESARLVDVAPWLTARVPPPPLWLIGLYYCGLAGALVARGVPRAVGVTAFCVSTAAIVSGQPAGWWRTALEPSGLRMTTFDVGQGDATLLQFADRSTLLIDTGGVPFGGGTFDIGSRVLSPALWALGLRRVDTLLMTHGDPDHIGGARAIIEDFGPTAVWEGIPVANHAALQDTLAFARSEGALITQRRVGDEEHIGAARVRVLHPAVPDWERRRVRNDDSVVVEVTYGDVAVLLLGDVGVGIEREIAARLTPAKRRILKVAHHGSRTSTSRELLDAWRPDVAIISCGRGNSFGHPAPEVLQRLESVGATIYRTDLHGQVTLETDGTHVRVRTYVGRTE